MRIQSLHRQAGLNLIEVLIAALVLSVGLLSLAGLQVATLKTTQDATQKQQAAFMVHELLERMRSNRSAVYAGHYVFDSTGSSCSSMAGTTDCSSGTSCTPAEVAAYDIFTVKCGSNNPGAIDSGVDEYLTEGVLITSCLPAGCDPEADPMAGIRIEVSWQERVTNDDLVDADGETLESEEFILSVDASI